MQLFCFPSTTCWRHYLLSIIQCFILCHRLIDHRCEFISELYILSHWSMSVLCANTMLFDYCSFLVQSDIRNFFTSSFVLFSQDCFGNSGSLWVYINFWIICSSFVKKCHDILIRILINLQMICIVWKLQQYVFFQSENMGYLSIFLYHLQFSSPIVFRVQIFHLLD